MRCGTGDPFVTCHGEQRVAYVWTQVCMHDHTPLAVVGRSDKGLDCSRDLCIAVEVEGDEWVCHRSAWIDTTGQEIQDSV